MLTVAFKRDALSAACLASLEARRHGIIANLAIMPWGCVPLTRWESPSVLGIIPMATARFTETRADLKLLPANQR